MPAFRFLLENAGRVGGIALLSISCALPAPRPIRSAPFPMTGPALSIPAVRVGPAAPAPEADGRPAHAREAIAVDDGEDELHGAAQLGRGDAFAAKRERRALRTLVGAGAGACGGHSYHDQQKR